MRFTKIASALALVTASSLAHAATEIENNNSVSNAQNLVIGNSAVTINGTISRMDDVDFYAFYGKAGDIIDIDIDNGMSGAEPVDTVLTVIGPAPAYEIIRVNDDTKKVDSGSISTKDPMIEKLSLPASGKYHIAVTRFATFFPATFGQEPTPVFFDDRSFFYGKEPSNKGDYTLVVTPKAPPVQQISISIKPGSDDFAPINPKSKGKIPVAILSSPLFEALNVDVDTLTFGATGNEKSLSKCNYTGDDVNGDGRVDRICHFENQQSGFQQTSLEGILRGKTLDGRAFEGRGFLKVVPK